MPPPRLPKVLGFAEWPAVTLTKVLIPATTQRPPTHRSPTPPSHRKLGPPESPLAKLDSVDVNELFVGLDQLRLARQHPPKGHLSLAQSV